MSEKINWFPGHMQKARRQMEEQLKLVDIIVELRDARIPVASGNPLLLNMANNKPRLIILNKADLADENENEKWRKYFLEDNHCLLVDSLNQRITDLIVKEIKEILKDKIEKAKARGIRKKVLRAMVVGIPNVGKSTLINNIVKKKVAKTENRPGVTKAVQWIKINEDVELLDTPGVLWPKIENQDDARLLALLGSINDEILDKEALVLYALDYLRKEYPGYLNKRYEVNEDSEDLFKDISLKKGWIIKEDIVNKDTAYKAILKDIRSNNLGRITWQKYGSRE